MNFDRNFVEDDRLSEAEKDIGLLLLEACENGIAKVSAEESFSEGNCRYFTFDMADGSGKYTLCFCSDPDRVRYPKAQRAIKASRLVRHLTQLLRQSYSCYIVPSSIAKVPEAQIKKRLFSDTSIAIGKAVESHDANEEFRGREYEIDLSINIAIDSEDGNFHEHRTLIDTVVVSFEDGEAKYEYRRMPHLSDKSEKTLDANDGDVEYAERIIKSVSYPAEKKKILLTLAQSEGSELAGFLKELQGGQWNAGLVSVRPIFLFIDAMKHATFAYPLVIDGWEGNLLLTWGGGEKFADSPLYMRLDGNGGFVGLTFEPAEDRPEYKSSYSLIPALTSDKAGNQHIRVLTVKDPARNLPLDSAVRLSGISGRRKLGITEGLANPEQEWYLKSLAVEVDEGWYLREDCERSDFDGELHWLGKLTYGEKFVSADRGDTEFKAHKGERPGDGMPDLVVKKFPSYRRHCNVCGSDYYANAAVYKLITEGDSGLFQIDGSNYCPFCNLGEAKRLMRISDRLEGLLFDPDGKNSFVCTECRGEFYYNDSKPRYARKKCGCCENVMNLCHSCFEDKKVRERHKSKTLEELGFICSECVKSEADDLSKIARCRLNILENEKKTAAVAESIKTLDANISAEKKVQDERKQVFTAKVLSNIRRYAKYLSWFDRRDLMRAININAEITVDLAKRKNREDKFFSSEQTCAAEFVIRYWSWKRKENMRFRFVQTDGKLGSKITFLGKE